MLDVLDPSKSCTASATSKPALDFFPNSDLETQNLLCFSTYRHLVYQNASKSTDLFFEEDLPVLAMPERTKPPPDESVTYSSGTHEGPPDLRILHYNDVYHVDSSSAEPVGGVARFMTLIEHYRDREKFSGQPDPITLFSGDAFNPSLESSVTKGMLTPLGFVILIYPRVS